MTKHLLLAALLAGATLTAVADEAADTLQIVNNPSQVVVVSTPTTTSVVVNGKKGDKDFRYIYSALVDKNKATEAEIVTDSSGIDWEKNWTLQGAGVKKSKWKVTYGKNLYVGWLHPTDCPKWVKGSFEVGLAHIVGVELKPWNRGPVFSAGLGVGYKQFLAKDGMYYAKEGEALVGKPIPEGEKIKKTKIKQFFFQVPVMVTQNIYKNFAISLGGVLCANTYTHAFAQIDQPGEKTVKTIYKGLHQRFFSCDLMAIVGWTDILGVYVRYSPMTVMDTGMGPHIKSLSVGASFNF